MDKHLLSQYTAAVFTVIFSLFATPVLAQQGAHIPALLPMAEDVPVSNALAIDGEWRIKQINKRIRIQGGRAFAVDSWLHLMILTVQPNMVVSKAWQRTGPGQYRGQDLPLVGPFTARLLPNGNMDMTVKGVLGTVSLTLLPVNIDDIARFESEKSGQTATAPPRAMSPTVVYGFDGTNQDAAVTYKTNVWYFLKAHRAADQSVQNSYAPGVGTAHASTGWLSEISGEWFGKGGRQIIDTMYQQLVTNFARGHTGIVLVGFSRGAALAREFANVINERGDPIMYNKLKRPYGKAPKITFIGLFDTVYSFGVPINKGDYNYRKAIPANVMAVAHATAALEKRNTFDLWSIHASKADAKAINGLSQTGSLTNGDFRIEQSYAVGHDDVGGAQENNYHGYDALVWILQQGQNAGVNLVIPSRDNYLRFPGDEVPASGNGLGKRQVYYPEHPKKVPAIYYGDAKNGCEGKQVYRSGAKCYQCPEDYKRFSLTRKMTHPQACTERGISFDKNKVAATYVWEANGCPVHQFKYKGICMICPEGTKRDHIAGIDSGLCKVE